VKVLEAAENIRFLSQRITKNYLYFYVNPKKLKTKKLVKEDLKKMGENIHTIATTTVDEDTRNVLEFLTYSMDQIKSIADRKPDKEKAALMLDYSESLLEGANSITRMHTSYIFSESEKMLMKSKTALFQLVRSIKYYMALGVGLGNSINIEQMQLSINNLEKSLTEIYRFSYTTNMSREEQKLKEVWKVVKSLLERREKFFIAELVNLASKELEKRVDPFIVYYRKNQ